MANLYELSSSYAVLLEAYDTCETDEERDELLASMESVAGTIDEKADAYAKLTRNVKADVTAYREEANRLLKHARAGEHLIERLEANLLDAMKLTGEREIKTSIGKYRLQDNPWSAEVEDWERVPMEFRIPQPDKVDRKALIDRFKQTGEIIEGVTFKRELGLRFR